MVGLFGTVHSMINSFQLLLQVQLRSIRIGEWYFDSIVYNIDRSGDAIPAIAAYNIMKTEWLV